MPTIAETFDDHWIEDDNGCWIWQRACKGKEVKHGGGYPCLRVNGVMTGAHRYRYELEHGPIPDGLQIRHQCHNTKCVNPAHMLLGTNLDNARDKMLAGRCSSKLSVDNVKEIKRRYVAGESQRVIAADFDLHQADVSNIVNKKYWRYVTV